MILLLLSLIMLIFCVVVTTRYAALCTTTATIPMVTMLANKFTQKITTRFYAFLYLKSLLLHNKTSLPALHSLKVFYLHEYEANNAAN